jgi:hypothetical protein
VHVLRPPAGRHVLTALVRFKRGAGGSERLRKEFTGCAKRTPSDGRRS